VHVERKNTQNARQQRIIGAKRRAPPPMRLPPALSSLLACIAEHAVPSDAKIEKTLPSTSLKELDPPMQRLLLSPRQDNRDSVLTCHLWCIHTNGLWGIFENKKSKRGVIAIPS
jgi:hypothetical protein